MPATASRRTTESVSVLHLRTAQQAAALPIPALIELLDTLDTMLRLAQRAAWFDEWGHIARSDWPPSGPTERPAAVRRLRMASPLDVILDVDKAVVASAPAVGLLIYCVKQLWTIDLDLRTRRLERKKAFRRAQVDARRAEEMRPNEVWDPDVSKPLVTFLTQNRRHHERIDEGEIVDWEDLDWA